MNQYLLNTKQPGEALELLTSLEDNTTSLIFLDPQYEKVGDVSRVKDYPLHYQSDYQIVQLLKEIARVLKPSSFCLLWISKEILRTDRVQLWLLQATSLKIVDCLVWKKNNFGFGSYFRNKSEFAFLLQKHPLNSKLFKNRSFGNVWEENSLSINQRNHPHQKPRELIKSLIEATTQEGDLIADPCAGSFIVLEVCQETNRNFLGVDLTYNEVKEFIGEREREREREEFTE